MNYFVIEQYFFLFYDKYIQWNFLVLNFDGKF